MVVPLSYIHLDPNDCRFFDRGRSDDLERFASIHFFEHVEQDFARNKRPRTENGRLKLWNKSSRSYWLRRARALLPLPPILRPTWAPPATHIRQPAPPPPPPTQPAPVTALLSAQTLTIVAPIPSSTVSIVPIDAPPPRPLDLVAPAPGSVVEIAPEGQYQNRGTKRWREDDSQDLPLDFDRPTKRRLTDIGGERCPQFVLYNGVDCKERGQACRILSPARDQRRFIQASLEGNWRFAKTLRQRSTRAPKPGCSISLHIFS